MRRWSIRWLSYPVVFGVASAAILWFASNAIPYWPAVPMVALLGIGSVAVLESLQPYAPAWLRDHGDTRTDTIHFLVNLTVLYASIEAFSWMRAWLPTGDMWPASWPAWAQVALAIVVIDFGLYVMHWWSHRHWRLWLYHETHHSSERLYWLNGERRHPVHAVMMAAPGIVILIAAGAQPVIVASGLAILSVHLAFQHANLDYSVGVLRHLFGVAETHRWHHKLAYEDAQVNYGEWLMVWDHLFGTYRQPPGLVGPGDIGVRDRRAPATYLGQLARPFTADYGRARDATHSPNEDA